MIYNAFKSFHTMSKEKREHIGLQFREGHFHLGIEKVSSQLFICKLFTTQIEV